MKNFRQILSGIDVAPLLAQLAEHPKLWRTQTEWTAKKLESPIYETENIVLRYNKSSQPYLNDWDRSAFHVLTAAKDIIFAVMAAIPGEHLGKIVITRLKPGEKIDTHIDSMPPGIPLYFERYQIPLQVEKGVWFHCGDEKLYMKPGEAWWFNNQLPHAVFNDSKTDRISMLTDIRPFDLNRR